MKKKLTVIFLCVALAAIAIVGASLAYFTDTKSATNTFTVGNVKIDLIESKFHREGNGNSNDTSIPKASHEVTDADNMKYVKTGHKMFTNDEIVLDYGVTIMWMLVPSYVTYICIEILSGAVRGAGGGFGLNLPPEKITMHAIVNVMEGTTRINRCLEGDGYCSRGGVPDCPVHQFYARIQQYLDRVFAEMTIASLMEDA